MLPQSIRPSTGEDLGFDIRISGFFRGWVFRCFVMFSENKRICDASALHDRPSDITPTLHYSNLNGMFL